MPESPRRLFLRVGVKLMFLLAITTSGYVLLFSGEPQETVQPTQPPSLHINLADIPPDTVQRMLWQGGNLLLLRRSKTLLAALQNHRQQLLFPQPLPASAEIYVAFDRGSGLGCPLQWITPAAGVDGAPLKPWPGGLRDSCDGSWYDAAGRVFRGQSATRDLTSPAYRLTGELLEIGTSGDNPGPQSEE